MHIRVLVHALDRTGPPMLALGFAQWAVNSDNSATFDFVAFRGGPLLNDFSEFGPTRILLDPMERWDHASPDPDRVRVIRDRCANVGPADVVLAVSVSAGQTIPYIPRSGTPVATWSVEQGDDLRWLDESIGLVDATDLWLAGSAATLGELRDRLPASPLPVLVPEFIPSAPEPIPTTVVNCRSSLGMDPDGLLVIGAGIATHRKGADLFIEVALESIRRHGPRDQFVWIGGEHDESFFRLRDEAIRVGAVNVRFFGNVVNVEPWLAAGDVLLHTARLDSFPLICLHAASVGTPVIGFDGVGGLREMFGDATTAAPFPDIVGLTDRLDEHRTSARRSRTGEAQCERVRNRFTAERAAPTLMHELEKLVERHAHSSTTRPER